MTNRRTSRILTICLAGSALAISSTAALAKSPGIAVVSPAKGATVSGPVKVTVSLSAFKINAATVGKAPAAGMGHLHFSLDGGKFDQPKYSGANGALAKKLGTNGKYSPSVTTSVTYTGLPKGKHTLVVYLANNDHSNVGAKATSTFTVK